MKRLISASFLFLYLILKLHSIGNNNFDIIVRTGYSNLNFTTDQGSKRGGIGLGGGFEYSHLFEQRIGFSFGCDFYKFIGKQEQSFIEIKQNTYDSDRELCDITTYNTLSYQYSAYFICFPLSFQIRIPFAKNHFFLLTDGLKYGLFVSGNQGIRQKQHSVAYYDQWHLTIDDVHEFGKTDQKTHKQKLRGNNTIIAFSRLDVGIQLSPLWSLLLGIDFQYSLFHSIRIDTALGKVHMYCINFEIGSRFTFKNKKKHSTVCRCVRD